MRIWKAALTAAAAIAILAACSGTGGYDAADPSHMPTPSPFSQPPGGPVFDVTATEKDHAVVLRTGQTLLVVLHASPNLTYWSRPTANDSRILVPVVDPAAATPIGVSVAAFKAVGPGEATVTAVAGPNCPAGQPCPMFAVLYSLQVTVTA